VPNPPELDYLGLIDHVSIGHVGYIENGQFRILFDAGLPLGQRELGKHVPEDFVFHNTIGRDRQSPKKPILLRFAGVESRELQMTGGTSGQLKISGSVPFWIGSVRALNHQQTSAGRCAKSGIRSCIIAVRDACQRRSGFEDPIRHLCLERRT
jgi:hypothetical protein